MAVNERLGASFRDPSGFVFRREGTLFRQVNDRYLEHFEMLEASGLYEHLTESRLLIPHERVGIRPPSPDLGTCVIEPELVSFISYPYEWCFGQLKDAALATLDIELAALEHGMTLKDASAFNIQFHDGGPILIDSLSFERYEEGRPWIAYRQFCEHFLAPLLLISETDPWLGRLPRLTVEGIPLETASRLLPAWSWLHPSTLLHVHLHARSIRRYGGKEVPGRIERRGLSKRGLINLIEGLRRSIEKVEWSAHGTEWAEYEVEHGYTTEQMEGKKRLVKQYLDEIEPAVVWDLGANTGAFSRIAMHRGAFVVSLDFDPAAVERNYRRMKRHGETRLHPLWVDVRNPSPSLGWAGEEREGLIGRSNADTVLALALVHHLALGANVPLPMIVEWLSRVAPTVIVEFAPKNDPQVQRLLKGREDVFDTYDRRHFESALSEYFHVDRMEKIGSSGRVLYRCSTTAIEEA